MILTLVHFDVFLTVHHSIDLFQINNLMHNSFILQGEHKVFPWLQTFITRKLRGIQTFFFFKM